MRDRGRLIVIDLHYYLNDVVNDIFQTLEKTGDHYGSEILLSSSFHGN